MKKLPGLDQAYKGLPGKSRGRGWIKSRGITGSVKQHSCFGASGNITGGGK